MPPIPQRIIKERHNRQLFRSEPPANGDIVALFKGREEELASSVERLRYNLDAREDAEDADHFFGRDETKGLWIIHGPTRSGKSHLGRRILVEFPQNARHHKLVFPCRDRLEPAEIFQQIFKKIRDIFHECIARQEGAPGFKNDDKRTILVRETRALISDVAHFSTPNPPDTVATQSSRKDLESLKATFQAGLPAIIQFRLQAGTQTDSGTTYNATFTAPSAERYSTFCSIIIDTLVQINLLDHLLILVDDADLLNNEDKTTEKAQLKTVHLADALVDLHRCRGVDILVTSRSHYAISKKEFQELIDLTEYSMTTSDLIDIYHAHLKQFAWKDHPEGFLTEEALEKAAQWAARLPGIFLVHLTVALEAFKKEESWTLQGSDWYREIFKKFYDLHRKGHKLSASLEQAIKDQQSEIIFPKGDAYPFYGTKLDNVFIMPGFYDDTNCKILPLLFALSDDKT